jgi:hypothetical protein
MRTLSAAASATAIVIGVGGGAFAYQSVSSSVPDATAANQVSAPAAPVAAAGKPHIRFRYEPCKPPAVREGKACVKEVVKTVVVPTSAGSGPSAQQSSDDATPEPEETESTRDHEDGSDDGEHAQPTGTHNDDDGDDHEEDDNSPEHDNEIDD